MIIAKSFPEESSFSQHINKESDDCTLLRSENLGASIRTISLFPTFPFFIQNFINTEVILLALAGAQTSQGKCPRGQNLEILHTPGPIHLGPWVHSLSYIPHRLSFSNIQGPPQYLQEGKGTLWKDLSMSKQRNLTAPR